MAENLARIYGTEEDKTNCPFYFKIGACRHGDRCSRQHNRPLFSQTLLIPHMYTLPPVHPQTGMPTVNEKEHLHDFAEEVIDELLNFGTLEEFHVVGNLGEHMLGNVYLKYSSEEEAAKCLKALNGRFYGGRQLTCEFSPVSDFRESRCRQYDEETCSRGGFCNFMHMRPLPSAIRKELDYQREKARRRQEREMQKERERHYAAAYSGYYNAAAASHSSGSRRSRSRDHERSRRSSRDRDTRSSGAASGSSAPASSNGRERSRERERDRSSRDRDSRAPRSASEERRAKFAALNKAREAKQAAEKAATAGGDKPPQPSSPSQPPQQAPQ